MQPSGVTHRINATKLYYLNLLGRLILRPLLVTLGGDTGVAVRTCVLVRSRGPGYIVLTDRYPSSVAISLSSSRNILSPLLNIHPVLPIPNILIATTEYARVYRSRTMTQHGESSTRRGRTLRQTVTQDTPRGATEQQQGDNDQGGIVMKSTSFGIVCYLSEGA
jgi:hypothetical protein